MNEKDVNVFDTMTKDLVMSAVEALVNEKMLTF
jgi:hypothetical protein